LCAAKIEANELTQMAFFFSQDRRRRVREARLIQLLGFETTPSRRPDEADFLNRQQMAHADDRRIDA